jgi:hypothetical protein
MSVQKEQASEKHIDFIVNYIDILEADEKSKVIIKDKSNSSKN